MEDHICPWRVQHRAEVEKSRAEFEAQTGFTELVAESGRRGYRRITLSEQLDLGGVDAYSWRGGIWVKISA